MTAATRVARLGRLAIALAALSSCGGEEIRLGEATAQPNPVASPGGASGAGGGGSGGKGGAGASGRAAGSSGAGTGGSSQMAGAGGAGTNGDAGAGIESGAGGSGEAGAGGEAGASCEGGVTSPNEVLWIGDSWLTVPMNQGAVERVHDLARGAGVLGADDAYESQVEDGAKMPAVAAQYETQQATGPADVKVLLMDGGTYETLLGMGSQVSIDGAIADFEDFLAKVASDGTVEHIVYVLMPDLIPGVMAMRADMMTLCENSPVPCHFINLQDYWGNPNEYTSLALPTASGAIVIGDAIWAAMQQHCIAQ